MTISIAEASSSHQNYAEQLRQIRDANEMGYIYSYPDKRLYTPIEDPNQFVEGAWSDYEGPVGVYVHVPWCTPKPPTQHDADIMNGKGITTQGRDHLCSYCNLYTAVGKNVPAWYADSVEREAGLYGEILDGKTEAQSLYFGGGSPSLLHVNDMERMIASIEAAVGPIPFDFERAIEVIPDSVDKKKLGDMRRLFNRISVGVQSFDPNVLRNTGRSYPAEYAKRVIQDARDVGFPDINGDLIIGLQGSTEDTFFQDVETMIESGPTTITLYPNMLRPGTRAGRMAQHGLIKYPTKEEVGALTDEADKRLQKEGYRRLSLTCWTKTNGYQQGEQIYKGVPIIGFGAGARSYGPNAHYALPYTEDVRLTNNAISRWHTAIDSGNFPEIHGVVITPDMSVRSNTILGLMSQEGVDVEFLQKHFPEQFAALAKGNMLETTDGRVHYTQEGKSFSGAISALFFSKEDLQILHSKDSVRTH